MGKDNCSNSGGGGGCTSCIGCLVLIVAIGLCTGVISAKPIHNLVDWVSSFANVDVEKEVKKDVDTE